MVEGTFLRILLVEDSEDDAILIRRQLTDAGIGGLVECVQTTAEIVGRLADARWDLVITDNRLPGFEAPEVLRIVRAGGRDIPVIVVSGTIGEEAAAGLMKEGANDYVGKGNLARLGPAVERELRDARDRAARRAADERAWRLAYSDPVTELPNRNLLNERLARALGNLAQPLAVLWLEIQQIADVRNTLGGRQLDSFLRSAAQRFAGCVRDPAMLAHLSPGTFVVGWPGANRVEAVKLGDALIKQLATPLHDGSLRVRLRASVGVACHPGHGETSEVLLRRAAIAADLARRASEGVALYDPRSDVFTSRRLDLVTDLWEAADRGEFVLQFQPQVDLHTQRTVAVEALLRWNRPRVGLLSPDQFIPVAEQSGSIRPITAWVLAEALKCCAEWRNEGLPLGVSVNLSAAGIHEVGLADAIACQLEQHQLDPAALAVEVTEGALMRDPNGARATLERLRKLGAKAVIDDFGAGHSSLAYLKNLPVTALKIDRSFLAGGLVDPRDASIVRSTVGLAHNLMLDVVAEGVEDGATLERVSRLGCDEGQGYHIARPMSLPDMKEWLRISPFPAEA